MTYLLDTNICIYALKNRLPQVLEKIESRERYEICLSSIVLSELEYGASKSSSPKENRETFLKFAFSYDIISFDEEDARFFGMIRTELEKKGQIIGPYDLQIAAQALSRGLILITNNVKEFKRVKGLEIENWTI